MKLPNANLAIVDREKITDYLLNPAHPDNGGKAKFFLGLGFTAERWQDFADALRTLAISLPVMDYVESPHGIKYIVIGRMAEVQTSARCGLSIRATTNRDWLQLILDRSTKKR